MFAMRRTTTTGRAAGRLALVGSVGLCLLFAGRAFLLGGPGAAPAAPRDAALWRGTQGRHELEVLPFEQHSAGEADAQPRTMTWTSFVALMATLGLVAGLTTLPVRAEEAPVAAVEVAEAAPAVKSFAEESKLDELKRAAAPTKAERLSAFVEKTQAERAATQSASTTGNLLEGGSGGVKGELSKKRRAGVTVIKSSKKKVDSGFAIVNTEEGKKKVIISPADERDEDELPLSRSNPLALFILATFAPGIYLVFYVLGSLNVI